MKKNIKHSTTNAKVMGGKNLIRMRNVDSVFFAILAVAILTLIAAMSAYFIGNYFGHEQAVLEFFDKLQLRDKFMEMFDKFNTPATRRFNQGYFAFSLVSFAFLLLFAPKKEKGNCSLYVIYTLVTLTIVVYFTLAALFPDASMVDLWKSMPELFKTPIQDIFDKFLGNVEYFIAVISVSVFAVNVMIASANRNFANSVLLEEHTELKKRLCEFPSIPSKNVKKLALLPTYWGLFFFFVAQIVLPVLFTNDAILIGRIRLVVIVLSPVCNGVYYGMNAKIAMANYRIRYINVFRELNKKLQDQSAVSHSPMMMEQPVANPFDDEHNKSMFWMREAKYWHSQAHNKQCFEDHYSNIMNDFQDK